jgi:acylglycerol lipase
MRRAEARTRRRTLFGLGGTAALAACQPLVQRPGARLAAEAGPRLEPQALVSWDGARLPLEAWPAQDPSGAPTEPWAVIVGLHGMNDYRAAFTLPGPYWAARGVTTYAYDQRGFGSTAERGVWGGAGAMREDLRTACALLRARHPGAVLAVVGESMGGAVAITAFASAQPPDADRLVLAAPAVWGWREQGPLNSALLWAGAHVAPSSRVTAPEWLARRIWASDNVEELRRMGSDTRMIFATRIDTIYGLVGLMQDAADEVGAVRLPTLYQYGAHDEIIPKAASLRAARQLRRGGRSAYYRTGWHLLLRDKGRDAVLDDALAFIRNPEGPLPSGAPPIGPAPQRRA